MVFVIGKPAFMDDAVYYVTAIKKGGLSIDNMRQKPTGRYIHARRFAKRETAQSALDKMISVGAFDDYQIFEILA